MTVPDSGAAAIAGSASAAGRTKALRVNDLVSIDAMQLADLNRLYTSGDFPFRDSIWRWALPPRRPVDDLIDYWIELESGSERLYLGMIAATTDREIDFSWREYEGDVKRIAWCASHERLLEIAQQLFQRDWLPCGFPAADAAGSFSRHERFIDAGFAVECGGRPLAAGRCRFEPRLIPDVQYRCDGPLAPLVRRLPFAIPVVVDRATLSVPELLDLEIGAVVRLRRRAFLDIGARLTLEAGGADILVKVSGSTLVVLNVSAAAAGNTGTTSNKETRMTTNESEPERAGDMTACAGGPEPAPIDIASMPVEIRFEAGRIATSYDELRRMRPGFTFELGCRLSEQTIDITANGALIARGELVGIGSELGVRVTALGRMPKAAG